MPESSRSLIQGYLLVLDYASKSLGGPINGLMHSLLIRETWF